MLKETTKAQVMAKLGLNYEVDQHNNAAAMAALSAKALNRSSTTAKAVSAAGGVPLTEPRRVDRHDTTTSRSAPAALHDAYLAALKGRHESQ